MITWTPPAPSVALVRTGAGTPQGSDLDSSGNHAWVTSSATVAVAAQIGFIGVGVPAASGKRSYIDAIIWWLAAANVLNIFLSDAAQGASGGPVISRLAGGAALVTLLRTGTKVPAFGGVLQDTLLHATINDMAVWVPPSPMVIDQNTGLYVVHSAVNTAIANVTICGREY